MAANINLQTIIEKEQQDLTKYLSIMDYTKTDEQLRNIAEGLKELDKDHNALLFMRINTDNQEVAAHIVGSAGNLSKMIALTMRENEAFKHIIFQSLAEFSFLKLVHKHTADDCAKCKEPECRTRKADYKGE